MLHHAVARLGVDAPGSLAVVASAVGIHLAFLLMARLLEGVRDAHLVPDDLLRDSGRG